MTIPEAFQILTQTSRQKRLRPWQTRLAPLRQLRRRLLDDEDNLVEAFRLDFNKPRTEVLLSEIEPVIAEIDFVLKHLPHWAAPQAAAFSLFFVGSRSEIRHEPKGNVLIISPWNFPLNLALAPLVSAWACGNNIILKPSELTPHVSAWIAKNVSDIFPADELQVFQGGVEVSTALLQLPFDHIFFTGSTSVGRIVMSAAAKNLTSVTLELGGKSPVIVGPTADLKLAAQKIIWGKLLNLGQTCVAPDLVFVENSRAQSFVQECQMALAKMLDTNSLPTAVNERHAERLRKMLSAPETASSGKAVTPAFQDWTKSNWKNLSPSEWQNPLLQEEIFGPLFPILSYDNLDDLILHLQKQPRPLALYVFSRDKVMAEKVTLSVISGGVVWNDVIVHFVHKGLPFGGIGASGMGSCHGWAGLRAFTHERAVLKQGWSGLVFQLFFPPYREWQNKVLRFYLRYFRGI